MLKRNIRRTSIFCFGIVIGLRCIRSEHILLYQGIIGAAKTSAYYAVAPFIGTLLSFIVFEEKPLWSYFVGLGIMILGTVIVVIDTLVQKHNHTHKHVVTHTHDGSTHSHTIEHSHDHNHYVSDKNHKHYQIGRAHV